MKRVLLASLCLFIAISAYSQETLKEGDYIVTLKKDTIWGEIKQSLGNDSKASTYRIKTTKDEKSKYDGSSASFMHYQGVDYYPQPISPEKNMKKNLDFMVLIMGNDKSMVYLRPYNISEMGQGGGLELETVYDYYLFSGGKFIKYLDKKNYKSLLPKYFPENEVMVKEIKTNKKLKFEEVFKLEKPK